MEELINQYRYLVGGYYGVSLIDEYPVKEYILKESNQSEFLTLFLITLLNLSIIFLYKGCLKGSSFVMILFRIYSVAEKSLISVLLFINTDWLVVLSS